METIKYLGCFLNVTESQKLSGADVSFHYEDGDKYIIILACQDGEVWQQWAAENKYLSLNVDRVESWFKWINNLDHNNFTI
jgi:hypothetical protein